MNPPRRDIVFYSTNWEWAWGAPDYVWPEAARRLRQQEHAVTAVVHPGCLSRPEIQNLRAAGCTILEQPPRPIAGGRSAPFRRAMRNRDPRLRRLRHQLREAKNPHYFINQGGSYDILVEPELQESIRQPGASYDLFFRSNQPAPPFSAEPRQTCIELFDRARRCWFNSRWTQEITESQLLHRLGNAGVFPHRIRFAHDAPLPWPAPGTPDRVRLAAVSRIDVHHKGLDVLLEALAHLPTDFPAWTLGVFGEGPDLPYLQGLARWLKLEDRVTFHGHVQNIQEIWSEYEMLILTSRYEGLGVAMLEAMACGRPVLRTPYGGFAEWMVEGKTGFRCPAAEPDLILAALQSAVAERPRWPEMGRAAHARIQELLPVDPWRLYLEPFASTSL